MKAGKLFGTLAIMLVVFFGIKQLQASDGIDVKQALSMSQQGALLLDVREPEEYAAIHAPNAKLIPLGQLGSRLPEIANYKDKPIVVMCRSGHRSSKAVAILKDAGYSQVSNVRGGINEWERDGLEVVRKS
jgi:rhodanese-related sulfurtransferase